MRVLLMLTLLLPCCDVLATPEQSIGYPGEQQRRSITIEGRELPVLVRTWEGKRRHGAALIFADTGFGPDAPGLVAYLHEGLGQVGWASLSLTPPKNPPHPSFTTAAEEITKAGERQLPGPANQPSARFSAEAWQQHVERQLGFVESTLGQLEQIGSAFPGKRILIGMDRSGALLLKLLSDGKVAQPDLLVIINPYSESPQFDQLLPELVARQTAPLLDIQSPDGHSASLANARRRAAATAAKGALAYRQLRLDLNISEPDAWAEVLAAIRGFAATIKSAQ